MNQTKKVQKLFKFIERQKIEWPFWSTILLGIKLEINDLPNHLNPGESIYGIFPCKYKGKKALVAVTDNRILLLNRGLLHNFSNTDKESIFYHQISSIKESGIYFRTVELSIPGTGNDLILSSFWPKDGKKFTVSYNKAIRELDQKKNNRIKENLQQIPKQTQDHSFENKLLKEKVQQLKDLRSEGTITSQEFIELVDKLIEK